MQRIVQLRGGEAPALVAALGTVVLWSSAFVGIRSAGRSLSPEALALGRLLVSSVALGAFAAVRRERLPARRDLARIALLRRALARRLQHRPERGRAARRRRHGGDAREHRADPDRVARRHAAPRRLPARPARRLHRRLRRHRDHRPGNVRRRWRGELGSSALRRRSLRVCRRRDRAEARAHSRLGVPGDVDRVHRRDDRLLAADAAVASRPA